VVAGALSRYLAAKDETPEGALAATLPVNLRTRRTATEDNNQVGSIFASLHTDISDPLERLKAIHISTSEGKEFGEASPLLDTIKAAGVLNPAITRAAAAFWSRRHLSRLSPLNVSTVITNVPGPGFDLYCAGARMVQYHGLGLLTPGVGLFHTIFTQSHRVNLSVLGDREIMPDPEFYMQCVRESWDELYRAASRIGKNAAKRPARKKAPARKAAAKKAAAKKTAAAKAKRKPAPPGQAPAKKAAAKKAPARKSTAKARKAPAKKAAAKKTAAKKAPVKKSASKPSRAKQASATRFACLFSAPAFLKASAFSSLSFFFMNFSWIDC
jgi:hypothetical protein